MSHRAPQIGAPGRGGLAKGFNRGEGVPELIQYQFNHLYANIVLPELIQYQFNHLYANIVLPGSVFLV